MPFDAGLLAEAEIFSLVCPFGELDITFYDDIIRSKEAANRPKDREALATLRLLRDELHRLADEE